MSDYGSELEFGEEFESQMQVIEEKHSKAQFGGPPARIEVEYEEKEPVQEKTKETVKSLWELYRLPRGGSLSVTDLVSPLWCEYQHQYRLYSLSSLPLSLRPDTFVTAQGNEIALNKKQVEERDIILKGGNVVHEGLEREINGVEEKIRVDVKTREEGWVLRIVNLLSGLKLLRKNGTAREIPVFGLLDHEKHDGLVVFGVIDQVERRTSAPPLPIRSPTSPAASPSKKKKNEGSTKDEGQSTLDTFLGCQPVKVATDIEGACWTYVLSDTKTRYNFSLPYHNATKSSQLQLTLYHSLFSTLIFSTPNPFSWDKLYSKLSLHPSDLLSSEFMAQIITVVESNDLLDSLDEEFDLNTLGNFVSLLEKFVGKWFGGGRHGMDETLEISYRLRNTIIGDHSRRVVRKEKRESILSDKERDSKEAIRLSLLVEKDGGEVDKTGPTGNAEEEELARVIALSLSDEAELRVSSLRDEVIEEEEEAELLPFFASASVPELRDGKDDEEDRDLADTKDLPPNSQHDPVPLKSRYNFRRWPPPAIPPSASPSIPSPSPSSSPPKSPSPKRPKRSPPSLPHPEPILAGTLIGTQTFAYSWTRLEDFLGSSLGLWRGEREPVGVELEETGRCRTCEFESDCEWREMKSREAVERNKLTMRGSRGSVANLKRTREP